METSNKEIGPGRNDYIDYIKGILIILVVFGHSIQYIVYKGAEGVWVDPVFKMVYMFHMPLFMAISGYVSYRSINRDKFSKIFGTRFIQLIIPIICWSTILESVRIIVIISLRGYGGFSISAYSMEVLDIILSHWFLWCVLGSASVLTIMRICKLDNWIACLSISIIFILLIPDDIYTLKMFKYMFVYFCIGYCMARFDAISLPVNCRIATMFLLFIISGMCFMAWDRDSYIYISSMALTDGNLSRVLFRYVSAVVVSAAFITVTSIIYKTLKSETVSSIGRNSLSIYILQACCWNSFLIKRIPSSGDPVVLSFIFAPIFAILLSNVLHQISKYLGRYPLMGRLLLGRVANRSASSVLVHP